jgi:hypothetical protein
MGRRFDYLAWNNAAERVLAISAASIPYERNLVWRFFTDPMMRKHFSHWEQMARGLLAEFRATSARYPGDEWFEELMVVLQEIEEKPWGDDHLFHLGDHSKQAGDEGHLTFNVPLGDIVDLSFAYHAHDLIALECSLSSFKRKKAHPWFD